MLQRIRVRWESSLHRRNLWTGWEFRQRLLHARRVINGMSLGGLGAFDEFIRVTVGGLGIGTLTANVVNSILLMI